MYLYRNYFPKHQAALIIAPSEPPATQRSTGTSVNTQSGGTSGVSAHMVGMLPTGNNQFTQAATHIQGNAVTNQNAYMGGRLTPQAMQQGEGH